MPEAPKRPNWVEVATLIIAVVGLTCTVVGGTVYYFTLTSVERQLKQSELETATEPTVSVQPVVNNGSRHPQNGEEALQFVSLQINMKNVGTAPVHLGRFSIRVEEGLLSQNIRSKIDGLEKRAEALSAQQFGGRAASGAEQKASPLLNGALYALDAQTVTWQPLTFLKKAYKVDYPLLRGQEASFTLDYILEDAKSKHKTFRFFVTVSPKDKDSEKQFTPVTVVVHRDAGPLARQAFFGMGVYGYGYSAPEKDRALPSFLPAAPIQLDPLLSPDDGDGS